jgi:hypothetical protein
MRQGKEKKNLPSSTGKSRNFRLLVATSLIVSFELNRARLFTSLVEFSRDIIAVFTLS